MKDIPDNYVYSFAVVEESDNTKKNEPLNLLEFYFTNQDGSSFETRMDMSASIALIGQVTKIACDIIKRYPISDTDKELEIPDNIIQLLKNHD
jgi:hypothetical protein|tara:strand:- start:175 stop:453 length:279 start_codon:yes stop_codon:yes gene_type:complete